MPRRYTNDAFRASMLLACTLVACAEPSPTESNDRDPQRARTAAGTGVTVTSTSPEFAPRGMTVTVRVLGSGFASGARAVWALKGDTTYAKTRVKTNSTTYVSSTEVQANITIDSTATLGLYDVVVLAAGKKGIGIEMFEVSYAIVDLGDVDDFFSLSINSSGQVAAATASSLLPFVWTDGVRKMLPLPSGRVSCYVAGINDGGSVTGTCHRSVSDSLFRAFVWTASGPQELPAPAGVATQAHGIDNSGAVIGYAGGAGVIWKNGVMTTIGGSPWGISSTSGHVAGAYPQAYVWTAATGKRLLVPGEALDVNDQGVAVGWGSATGSYPLVAFSWSDGQLRYIGTLGGESSVAFAVNASGQVVGRSDATYARRQTGPGINAFVWSSATGMQALPHLNAAQQATANDINDAGMIVGVMRRSQRPPRGVLWLPQ
jgi:uncharacterized membrane protein